MEKSLVKLFISFTENLKSMLRPLFHFNVAISCTAHPQFAAGYHRIGRCFVVSAALQEAVSHNQATGTSACPHGHWGGTDKGIWFHLLSKDTQPYTCYCMFKTYPSTVHHQSSINVFYHVLFIYSAISKARCSCNSCETFFLKTNKIK